MSYNTLYKYFNYFLRLWFPKICSYCNNTIYNYELMLCKKCYNKLSIIDTELYTMLMDKVLLDNYNIDLNRRISAYILFDNPLIKNILHKIKYESDKNLAVFMGRLYARYLYKMRPSYISDVDAIIPVPISNKKLNKRGYNQSEIIANQLHKIFNQDVSVRNDILVKTKDIQGQATKNFEERLTNIIGAFDTKTSVNSLANKHILLVDDVFTTGATLAYIIKNILNKISNIKISVAVLSYRPLLSS